MAVYSVWLTSSTGQRIKFLDRVVGINYILTVNQTGIAEIDVPDLSADLIQDGARFEIWRQVIGGQKYLEGNTVWLIRDWEEILSGRGEEVIRLTGYSGNDILNGPIVAYKSGTAQASKSDYADDMMKALVRENLGSLATDADRDLSAYISVEDDRSDGPSTSKSFAYRNVLNTLREIAQDADDQGTPVFFGLSYDPADAEFTFATRTGQWGIDHSDDGAAGGRVVLSPKNGTLREVRRSYLSANQRNYVYVGGQGQGSDRQLVEVEDADRAGASPFSRRELFVDARISSSTSALQAEGRAALKSNRPVEIFSAKIRDTEAIQYGREYGFGDRVIVEYRGRTVEARLDSVRVRVQRGREDINAELRADA